jgi:cyclic pyranopterin monophosphate synthase
MKKLTHIDRQGNAHMIDVGGKKMQARFAKAEGHISLQSETIQLIQKNLIKKGDVLSVAEIAGIQAAKRTSDLIPLCHNIVLDQIKVKANIDVSGVNIVSEVHSRGTTGVEMEALTAVSVALLTVYDMCKAADKSMMMGKVRLIEKSKTDMV